MDSKIEKIKELYDANLSQFENTASQISLILSDAISKENIRIHSLKYRVKEFESFFAKSQLKGYRNPLTQCEDIAGCRVICLFKDDIPKVLKIIQRHFVVLEKIEKKKKVDQFAYAAHHVIVQLEKSTVKCEIQVRTILQDAWAEVEHYINYKHIGADEIMLRKVNALSALLEVADDQFHQIHDEFQKLKEDTALVKRETINPVMLYHYCRKTFPWAWNAEHTFEDANDLENYAQICALCVKKRILTLEQLHELYQKQKVNIEAADSKHVSQILNSPVQWPSLYKKVKATNHFYSPVVILNRVVNGA